MVRPELFGRSSGFHESCVGGSAAAKWASCSSLSPEDARPFGPALGRWWPFEIVDDELRCPEECHVVADAGDRRRRPRSLAVLGVRAVVDVDPLPVDEWDGRQHADVRLGSARADLVQAEAEGGVGCTFVEERLEGLGEPVEGRSVLGFGDGDRVAVPADVDVHRLLAAARESVSATGAK